MKCLPTLIKIDPFTTWNEENEEDLKLKHETFSPCFTVKVCKKCRRVLKYDPSGRYYQQYHKTCGHTWTRQDKLFILNYLLSIIAIIISITHFFF
jgi:hypothetical protein